MASLFVRTERTASIFKRITGLMRSGKMKWEDRPLWYDAFASHPPFDEPVWDAKMPKHGESVRKIFYEEDLVRAKSDPSGTFHNIIDHTQKGGEILHNSQAGGVPTRSASDPPK